MFDDGTSKHLITGACLLDGQDFERLLKTVQPYWITEASLKSDTFNYDGTKTLSQLTL